ncbi:MAG: hypothetical protein ACRD0U_12330 [Acidimicrobiales bacterium]
MTSTRASPVNELTADYATGAWSAGESRDYHVCVEVPPGDVGDEKLAGRISRIVDGELASQALVKAIWTDDDTLSTRISPQVAHYTGQADMARAIHEGLEAGAITGRQSGTTAPGMGRPKPGYPG